MAPDTYTQAHAAMVDVLNSRDEARKYNDRGSDKWPSWLQLALAVLAVVVSVVAAYGALNTRLTVVESKLDDLKQQIGTLRR